MKIKKIVLCNFGPFRKENVFEFKTSKSKNIVLFGGKNGAGKSSFFKAAKTCLYGCKAWGFSFECEEYFSIVETFFNQNNGEAENAFVEMEMIFSNGKETNVFCLKREWKKNREKIKEEIFVKKNGEPLLKKDAEKFCAFLCSDVPFGAFNFYFFDGEKIADYFLGKKNENFKAAFLRLYGLDCLSVLCENFERNAKKSYDTNEDFFSYFSAKKNFQDEQEKFFAIKNTKNEIEKNIKFFEDEIVFLEKKFKNQGGLDAAKKKQIEACILKNENEKASLSREAKDVANHFVPFLILQKNLGELLAALLAQQNEQKNVAAKNLFSEDFEKRLDNFLSEHGEKKLRAKDIKFFFEKEFPVSKNKSIFDFSQSQTEKIIFQIYEKMRFKKSDLELLLSKIENLQNENAKLKQTLKELAFSDFENFLKNREEIFKKISFQKLLLEKKINEEKTQEFFLENAKVEFEKAKKNREEILKNKEAANLSERAAAAFSILEERLVFKKEKILSREFSKCFSAIINKTGFANGIAFDKNICAIPYKFVCVKKEDEQNFKKQNAEFLSFFSRAEIKNANKKNPLQNESRIFPFPINAPFSQGEKQVFIMALYFALIKTCQKDIPVFLDTPFARIDGEHRKNIAHEIFCKIPNQIFIFSTDQEIEGEVKKTLDEKISSTILFKNDESNGTKIFFEKYFGSEK